MSLEDTTKIEAETLTTKSDLAKKFFWNSMLYPLFAYIHNSIELDLELRNPDLYFDNKDYFERIKLLGKGISLTATIIAAYYLGIENTAIALTATNAMGILAEEFRKVYNVFISNFYISKK